MHRGVGTFQCGDDAFELSQFVGGADGLVVIYGENDGALFVRQGWRAWGRCPDNPVRRRWVKALQSARPRFG